MADNSRIVMKSEDGWGRVFELMKQEDPSIPTEQHAAVKSHECDLILNNANTSYKNSDMLSRVLNFFSGEREKKLGKFNDCQRESDKISGMNALASAIARYEVTVVDKTDVGRLTQGELDKAVSYARSEFERYRKEVVPTLKKTSIDVNPLLALARDIENKAEKIRQKNWLGEHNPEYLKYLEEGEK